MSNFSAISLQPLTNCNIWFWLLIYEWIQNFRKEGGMTLNLFMQKIVLVKLLQKLAFVNGVLSFDFEYDSYRLKWCLNAKQSAIFWHINISYSLWNIMNIIQEREWYACMQICCLHCMSCAYILKKYGQKLNYFCMCKHKLIIVS